ncbi:hypothetical protein [Methylobacterium sp. J-092]|uniref:hypothetical protein n=1 Tax=Methylobacterium sp. J-092 TaxID=2836667 RepID=UPI001FBAA9EA|nr:hypothetical protein [Methylobacterium sp. J-092]MCJ2009801.1 hypothetical protein [Methylobacterium sp. J-092]
MRVREKGKADGEHVHMSWDEAQAALAAGTHEVAEGSPPDDAEGEGDAEDGGDGLDTKTRPELEALAAERGLDVSGARNKGEIIEALRAPR